MNTPNYIYHVNNTAPAPGQGFETQAAMPQNHTRMLYHTPDNQFLEITRDNWEYVQKNGYTCLKHDVAPEGYISPVMIKVTEDKVEDYLNQNSSTVACPGQETYSNMACETQGMLNNCYNSTASVCNTANVIQPNPFMPSIPAAVPQYPTRMMYQTPDNQFLEVTRDNWAHVQANGYTCLTHYVVPSGYVSPVMYKATADQVEEYLGENSSTLTCPGKETYSSVKYETPEVLGDSYNSTALVCNTVTDIQPKVFQASLLPEPIQGMPEQSTTTLQINQLYTSYDSELVKNIVDTAINSIAKINHQLPVAQKPEKNITSVSKKEEKEKFNPAVLAKELLAKFTIIRYKKGIYLWCNNHYRLLDKDELTHMCEKIYQYEIEQKGVSYYVTEIVKFILYKADMYELFEDTSSMIVARNNVFNINSEQFVPITPDLSKFMVLHSLKVPFLDGECPIFDNYIYNIAGGQPWLINRFWQALGLLLSSDIKAKRIVVLVGTGGSGKSTFGNIVREFFYEENVTAFTPMGLLEKFAGAALVNSAVNICMDLPSIPFDANVVARIKGLSGGDCIEGELKFMSNFSYVYKGHLLFGSNHPIRLTYPDEAFDERLLLLPCDYKIPQDKRDPYFIEKIKPELPVIATKAALYFAKVRKNNYRFDGDDLVQQQEIIQQPPDAIMQRFINECCIVTDSQDVFTPTQDLYSAFDALCKERKQENFFTTNTFSKAITTLVPNSKTFKKRVGAGTVNCRTCIKLKEKEEQDK